MTAINGNYINYQDWLNTDGTSQTSSNDDLTVFSVGRYFCRILRNVFNLIFKFRINVIQNFHI